ncbi:hypothetical protein C8R44DRAFT_866118 [Mycena epipterygia]|nr:hypothetical protein C8R44DRAFT_866118 [Mycena epipterygia]
MALRDISSLALLMLRGETAPSVLRIRAVILSAFRQAYAVNSIMEVTSPCLVQAQVESITLFKLDYYGQPVLLTQSSQLYLETCLTSLGDVFCVQGSFQAKNSHTRRHLSEHTHLEAELAFTDFNDLMQARIFVSSLLWLRVYLSIQADVPRWRCSAKTQRKLPDPAPGVVLTFRVVQRDVC